MRVKLTEEEKRERSRVQKKKWREENREKAREVRKNWALKNPEKVKAAQSAWGKKNKEKVRKTKAEYRGKNIEKIRHAENKRNSTKREARRDAYKAYRLANIEKVRLSAKDREAKRRLKNREKIEAMDTQSRQCAIEKVRAYDSIRHKREYMNLNCRLRRTLSARVRVAVKNNSGKKAFGSIYLLGCSIAHARQHLESQFLPGMTWENHSTDGWHIDHIKPCASFDLTDPEQQKRCFHYTNLQPLWATDNLSKGKKIDWQPQRQSAQP